MRTAVREMVAMFLSRRGSLHALEQTKPSRFWSGWLGAEMPSVDSVGRICSRINVSDVRKVSHQVYSRLKRMKALVPPEHGLMQAVTCMPLHPPAEQASVPPSPYFHAHLSPKTASRTCPIRSQILARPRPHANAAE